MVRVVLQMDFLVTVKMMDLRGSRMEVMIQVYAG